MWWRGPPRRRRPGYSTWISCSRRRPRRSCSQPRRTRTPSRARDRSLLVCPPSASSPISPRIRFLEELVAAPRGQQPAARTPSVRARQLAGSIAQDGLQQNNGDLENQEKIKLCTLGVCARTCHRILRFDTTALQRKQCRLLLVPY